MPIVKNNQLWLYGENLSFTITGPESRFMMIKYNYGRYSSYYFYDKVPMWTLPNVQVGNLGYYPVVSRGE